MTSPNEDRQPCPNHTKPDCGHNVPIRTIRASSTILRATEQNLAGHHQGITQSESDFVTKNSRSLQARIAGTQAEIDDKDFYGFKCAPSGDEYQCIFLGSRRWIRPEENRSINLHGSIKVYALDCGGAFDFCMQGRDHSYDKKELIKMSLKWNSFRRLSVEPSTVQAWNQAKYADRPELDEDAVIWKVVIYRDPQEALRRVDAESTRWSDCVATVFEFEKKFTMLVHGTDLSAYDFRSNASKLTRWQHTPLSHSYLPDPSASNSRRRYNWRTFVDKDADLQPPFSFTQPVGFKFDTWTHYAELNSRAVYLEERARRLSDGGNSDKAVCRQLDALDKLDNNPKLASHFNMKSLLKADKAGVSPERDILKYIEHDYPRPEEGLQLTEQQLQFVKACRRAPNGLAFIIDHTDTDSGTDVAIAISKLHMSTKAQQQVLAVSTTSETAKRLAARFEAALTSIKKVNKMLKERYIVCVTDEDQDGDTLRHAAAVVTTIHKAATPSILAPIAATAALVLIDRATGMRESSLWPIFAADLLKQPGFLGFGVANGTMPERCSDVTVNPHVRQLEISLPIRLLHTRFPVSVFK